VYSADKPRYGSLLLVVSYPGGWAGAVDAEVILREWDGDVGRGCDVILVRFGWSGG
jgi:hypothetical protein